MKNPMTPAGIKPATYRFVAQHPKSADSKKVKQSHYRPGGAQRVPGS